MEEREPELIFEPIAVCDGLSVTYYDFKPNPGAPARPTRSERLRSFNQPIYGMTEDVMVPWPDLMPEQVGHPYVAGPGFLWEYALDTKPSDGPPGTLKLHARHPIAKVRDLHDNYRLWIDPEKNDLAMKAEISTIEVTPGSQPDHVVHVETRLLTDLARSPNGFWYPTRVLRKGPDIKTDQATRYLLDFDADLPDEFFEPKKAKQ